MGLMADRLLSATALLRTSARIRRLKNRPIMVKLGGSALDDPDATISLLTSCVALQSFGIRMVLVHGGGKAIDRNMAAAGLTPRKISGIRHTDAKTLEIVVDTLLTMNSQLRRQFAEMGGNVGGFIGEPTVWPIRGEKLMLPGLDLQPIDIGFVGKVTQVDSAIHDHLTMNSLPILPSLAVGSDFEWLNVNADTVASFVGGEIQAETIYFLTDTPGILRDRANPASLISHLTASAAQDLISSGVISGGMIPKVEACFNALSSGIERAVILDGRDPAALLADFATDTPSGTSLTR
jgi:acetylglutamate kinase